MAAAPGRRIPGTVDPAEMALRIVLGQQVAVARQFNPAEAITRTDARPWTDRDGNGLPFDGDGNLQFNELGTSVPDNLTPTG